MTAAVFPFELMDNPAFKGRIDRIGAFVALLRQAKGGQIVSSFRKIADTIGWTLEAVRQFIAALVAHTLINTVTTQQGTTITICNYSAYCLPEIDNNTRTTQPATHQTDGPYIVPARTDAPAPVINPSLSKKESKKEESKKEDAPASPLPTDNAPTGNVISISDQSKGSRSRGTRLSPDWQLPRSWGERAMAKGLNETEVRREAEKFRNYWIAKSGKDATKIRWDLTWDNWTLTALERKGNSYGRTAEKHDVGMQVFAHFCGDPFADQFGGGFADTADEHTIAGDYERCDAPGLF